MMKRWVPWIVCTAIAVCAALSTALLLRQSRRFREAKDEVTYTVKSFCGNLDSELRTSAETLSERLLAMQRAGNAEEKQRAERAFDQSLPMGAGLSNERAGRGTASLSFANWFLFCSGLREIPDARRDQVRRSFSEQNRRFGEATDREVIADALARMAEVAAEVSAWPIRERRRPAIGE